MRSRLRVRRSTGHHRSVRLVTGGWLAWINFRSLTRKQGLRTQPLNVNRFCGDRGYFPVPVKGTVCGVFGALSLIVRVPVRTPVSVGVKVTWIWQVFFTASVLTQDDATIFCAKSPLEVMLLMSSVAVPVFLTVTVRTGAVAPTLILPQVRDAGLRLTAAPLLLLAAFTVRPKLVLSVKALDVPVIVTVTVPVAAVALAVKLSVLEVVAGLGLKFAVTPPGNPDAESVTLPVKAFCAAMSTVVDDSLP